MIVIGALLLIGLLGWALITSIDARIDAQPAARSLLPFDVWFVVPAVIGVAFALIRSGQFVTQMYSLKSSNHGLEFVLSTVFGLGRTTLVVSNGQIECMPLPATPESIKPGVFPVVPELKAHEHEIALQIGGPGILSVKSNNAVITERGGGFSRILAPGDHVLMSFERVRTVIDLRRQSFSSIETALTKDGIPAQSTVGTLFIIADQMPDEALPNPPLPSFMTVLRTFLPRKPAVSPTGSVTSFSREAVRMAVYETATSPLTKITWNATAHNGVAGQVRDTMSRRPLDQLFAPDDPNRNPRQEIGQEVF